MTQHLRKLISGLVVSAFLIGAFTIQTNAQDLTNLWQRSVAGANLPDWFTAPTVRGLDYNNGKIYVPDRNATAIRVLDAETGADVTLDTPFDLTGVTGGTYAMNDLKISEDGVIFLGNLATGGTQDFNFYWWTSEGGTFDGSYTFTGNTGRAGDHFAVVGSLSDNSIEVWIPEQSSNPGVIHVLTTNDNGATWTDNPITLTGSNVIISSGAHVMPLAAGGNSDFYIASNGSAPARYSKDGAFIEGSSIASTSRSGFRFLKSGDIEYLASYSYRPENNSSESPNGRIRLYDVTNPAAAVIVDESDVIGNVSGNSISGDVAFKLNDDGSLNLYAVDAANGFVAYTTAEQPYIDEPTNKIFFSEYIEGSSSNKAIEIYNATDSTVTLANYQIAQASNGSEWKFFNGFAKGATIAPGGVYTSIESNFNPAIFDFDLADEVLTFPSALGFNGDDARALIHIHPVTGDTTWIDLFGEELIRPATGWDVAGVAKATQDYTLIRKPTVTQGNATPLGSFGTNFGDSEWIVMPKDFTGNLSKPSSDLFAPMAGDYFVPKRAEDAQGFGSLVEALYYVSQGGLSAATTLYITGNLTETSGISIHREDLTESTPLTIKPAAGVTATLDVISNGGDGIPIIRTDYVTIDGSNAVDGNTRDLTITSSDDALTNMIWTQETVNTTIKNTILTYTGSSPKTAIAPNETGTVGSIGWLIQNNQIGTENGDFATGIGLWGQGSGVFNLEDAKVIGNDVFVTRRGLTTWYANNTDIIGNTISIVQPTVNLAWNAAIYLAVNMGTTNIIGNTINGLQVNRPDTPNYAAGILFNASLGEVNIFNNIINANDFKNVGAATGNRVFGIGINNAAGSSVNKIYHNTIRIGDNTETGDQAAFGLITVASTAQTWDLKNNILVNEKDADNATILRFPSDGDAIAGILSANYNNYYLSGANAKISTWTDESTDFATWQTNSGLDANTTTAEVTFVSDEDLRLSGLSIGDGSLAGMPIAAITTDIDGNARSAAAPYKGAFEGNVPLAAPSVLNPFTLLTPTAGTVLDLQGDPLTSYEFTWEAAGSAEGITYTFMLDDKDGDFSNPMFTEPDVPINSLPTNYHGMDSVLATLGFDPGETAFLKWTVVANYGEEELSATDAFTINITRTVSDAVEEIEKPLTYSLSQNYPNPFNPTSNIRFSIPTPDNVRIDVFNINGQLVKTLVNNRMNAGEHTVQFDAGNLASGVYIYRIISGNFVQSKKMTLIK